MKQLLALTFYFFSLTISAQTNIEIGAPAPEIVITQWLKNKPENPTLKNKYILLDFWATWCRPCLEGIPHLNELRREFPRQDLEFLFLTNERSESVMPLLEDLDIDISVAVDATHRTELNFGNGETGLARFPTSVLIDNKNIVRWVGDPAEITVEMMDRFLDPNLAVDPTVENFDGETDGPGWRKRTSAEKLTEKEYWDIIEEEDVSHFVHVFPTDDLPPRSKGGDFYSIGTSAYFHATTLGAYFSALHPEMKVEIPLALRDRKFTIMFKNDRPSRNSNQTIIRQIIAQTGHEVEFSTGEAKRHTLMVVNDKKLVPSQTDFRYPGCIEDDFGALQCSYMKLDDLVKELNKTTDDLWEYGGSNQKRYDFELFLSSPETILDTLKDYGLRVRSKKIEVEVVRVLE